MLGTAGRSWRPAPFLNHFLKTNAWRSAIKSQLLDQLLIIVYLWYLCAQTVRLNTRSCTQHSSSRPRSPSFQWHRCQAPKRLLQMPPSVGQNMPLQSIYVGNVSPNVLNVNTYVKQMMSVCTCQITAVYACQYNPHVCGLPRGLSMYHAEICEQKHMCKWSVNAPVIENMYMHMLSHVLVYMLNNWSHMGQHLLDGFIQEHLLIVRMLEVHTFINASAHAAKTCQQICKYM